MRLDVYPTQRVVALPAKVLANTAKNAVGTKSVNGGLGVEGMLPGRSVPDSEDRRRGDVEPPRALHRASRTT